MLLILLYQKWCGTVFRGIAAWNMQSSGRNSNPVRRRLSYVRSGGEAKNVRKVPNRKVPYRVGYSWNKGGRLKELRIRFWGYSFTYFFFLFILLLRYSLKIKSPFFDPLQAPSKKVFEDMDAEDIWPSSSSWSKVACFTLKKKSILKSRICFSYLLSYSCVFFRSHYNRVVLRRTFEGWRDEWWSSRREWSLTMRAECHYRSLQDIMEHFCSWLAETCLCVPTMLLSFQILPVQLDAPQLGKFCVFAEEKEDPTTKGSVIWCDFSIRACWPFLGGVRFHS